MTGVLTVVGLGPGPDDWVTPAARAAVEQADILLGYSAYTARITPRTGQIIEASDNREELSRAERALALTAEGKRVAVVSGGDPGVFAMAAAVFEAVDHGPVKWRDLDIRVEPGVTAMLAARPMTSPARRRFKRWTWCAAGTATFTFQCPMR